MKQKRNDTWPDTGKASTDLYLVKKIYSSFGEQEQSLTMFSVILSFPVTLPAIVGLRAFGAWMMLFLRRTLAEFVRLSAASVTSEHLRQHDKVIGSDNRSPTHLRAGFFV